MKVRKWFFLLPVVYQICGYTMYLHYLYHLGLPLSFSIFSQADIQLLLSSPNSYSMFMLFPLLVGVVFLLREYRNEMQVLRYENKKNILKRQIRTCSFWSIIVIFVGIMVGWVYGEMHGKLGMNWTSASSYYCVMTKQVLEDGNLAFVIFVNAIVLFARNFIFILLLLDCWWSGKNIVYGILVSVGICFIESGDARFPLILRTINVDYPVWQNPFRGGIAFAIAVGAMVVLLVRTVYWVKRKEF